ncbi:MAG: hypothetical protein ACK455_02410, partial [Bacteroidota bacterium]
MLTPTVTLSVSNNPICSGSSTTFTAVASNTGGGVINYNFRVNGSSVQSGPINSLTITSPVNASSVNCVITVTGGTCLSTNTATSNTIVITVNNNSTPSVSISATSTIFCAGNSVTVTATALNTAGGTVTYTFLRGGINVQSGLSNTYTSTTLTNGNTIKCNISITGGTCLTSPIASSNTITFTVSSPSVVLASTGTSVCTGSSFVLTATASNISGVGSVTYNFKRNGTTVQSSASNTYTTTTYANGDVFVCEMVVTGGVCSSSVTVNSNSIIINVLNTTVTITPSANNICPGTNVTFTAAAANTGGGTITYTFRKNGVSVQSGLSNTYTTNSITNGNNFSVGITVTGSSCGNPTANSNAVVMNVSTAPVPSVAISANPGNSVCSGVTVTYTAVPTNGGTSPAYQWTR